MAVVQTGIFRQPQRLAYLLASSATWQDLCGVDTEAEALQYVNVRMADESAGGTAAEYPRAVSSWQDADHFSRRKLSRDDWTGGGTLTLSIELEIPGEYEPRSADSHNWFMNKIGAIVSEMEANAGKGEPVSGETHLDAQAFTRIDGPWEYAEDEIEILDPDNYVQKVVSWIVFTVSWNG